MVSPVNALTGGILAVGGVVGLAVAYVAAQHRDHPAAGPLAKMATLAGLSGLCFATLALAPRIPGARALVATAEALLVFGAAYFLFFALAYTGRSDLVTPRRRWALVGVFGVVVGLATVEAVVTAPMTVRTVDGLTYPVWESSGPALLATVALVYAVIVAGFGLLGKFLIAPRNMYRKQTALLVGAMGLTFVGSLVTEAGLSPHPGLNLTAVFYSVETVLVALALFRHEFLNIEPLAPGIVLEEIEDPVVVLDESDRVVDANPAATALFGVADPVGTPVNDLLPGLLGAAARDEEYTPPRADGGGPVAVYDLNATAVTDQYDRDRGTVVVLRDVTVQKDRERTLESLHSVSRRFLAAESVPSVLDIAVTTAHDLLDCPYSGAMVYDEDENALRPCAWADPLAAAFDGPDGETDLAVGPDDGDVWTVFESGEPMLGDPVEVGGDRELPLDLGGSMLYPLGEHGVIGFSAGPDHDGFSGDDRRFADILASTTEHALDRVTKEEQLRESRQLLATKNEQIEFFNGVLRHDLLNGLQVVQGNLDVLATEVDGEATDHVTVIDDWIGDIMTLTQNVRRVTTAVTGTRDVEPVPVDIGRALREKVAKIRNRHDAVTVDVVAGLDALPLVRADQFLPEVFENLLGNAVEHNDRDHTHITVDGAVDGERVRLWIGDNGPGIDDDMKEAIFEEAVTSEESGSIGFGSTSCA